MECGDSLLVYILHNERIDLFRLPSNVTGKYIISDFDEFNNKRNLVNVEGKDNKWYIYNNENVKITYNDQLCDSIELCLYNFYKLTVLGSENIIFYILPSYDNSFSTREIIDNVSLTIGTDSNCDFIYKSMISSKQLELSYVNGVFTFKNLDPKVPIYLNDVRQDSGIVSNFDTLFIMGLKIIVCGSKIFINNPENQVLTNMSNKYKTLEDFYIVGNHDTDVRTFNNFYEESEYYAKSPVFKSQIVPFSVVITEPPNKAIRDKSSVLLNVIPTLLMTLSSMIMTISSVKQFRAGESSKEDLVSSLVMCLAMIVAGIVWPFVEKFYNNTTVLLSNVKRTHNYKKYLINKDKDLAEKVKSQKMAYVVNNIDLIACKKVIEQRTPELFNRDFDNDDFLTVRLGIGDIEAKGTIDYSRPDYTELKDSLLNDIDKVIEKNKYIREVPFIVSLFEKNVIAFIVSNKNLYKDYMSGIILQLLTFHSYYDLRIVVLTTGANSELSYLKDSNHCWNEDKSFRFYATNLSEAQLVSSTLERELKARKVNDKVEKFKPYYLIISNCIDKYRNLNIVNDILNSDKNNGFGLLMYDTKISNIPNDCTNFVNVSESEGTIFQINMNNILKFKPELTRDTGVNVDYCSRLISNVPLKSGNSSQGAILPDTVGFLQMYDVGNIEQLNCPIKWESSNPANSLSVPVGVDVNGNLIYLDLHEKNHGPHGLIAGMTGSGKSEFIVTYILSLALNYKPDEVQFLLIDYKGGGLAGAFENRKEKVKLPHLVGTITNLDKSEMKRTLVSIKSELQRRQKVFNEAKEFLDTGNIDIYKYQKLHREGLLAEPLSHLFIICDEFAELKAQQPDFMDELVSAARIGRSLGIHLILATQKPSGVVDEQIWSNSKFKVCCKVQTVDDSNEMIRKPDAAFLKESGRFYLQVGYDEYFILGQSAYSGMPYIPSETIVSKIDNAISFVNNTGEVYKNVIKKEQNIQKREDLGEELINILKYIIRVADEKHYKYQQLWLENIPAITYYDNLIKKYNIKPNLFEITPIIGEYDDPKNQKQGYVKLPLYQEGNVYICGASGSGKNTLLFNIIYSIIINHNCEEVNIYILDFGAEKLTQFRKAPQVGDVLTIEDQDRIKYLFYMLETEKNKRQKYYADNGGDFNTDILNKRCPFPNFIVIIYDIEVFKETFEELYDDNFVPFTRNCAKFGIYFIVCSASTSSLGFLAENNFPKKIMLNMVDQSDYSMFFDTTLVPARNPGRGLIQLDDVYEFQVPLIFDDSTASAKFNYVFEQLDKFLNNKAQPVPTIPDVVTFDYVRNCQSKMSLTNIPIGINLVTAQTTFYDFSKLFNLVVSSKNLDAFSFLDTIIKLIGMLQNKKVIVLNGIKDLEFSFDENIKYYSSSFKKIVPVIYGNVEKYNELNTSENEFVIFILGYNRINKILNKDVDEEDSSSVNLDNLLIKAKNNKYFKFVVYDTAALVDEMLDSDIGNFVDNSNGIWVGRGFDGQNCLEAPDSYNDNVKLTNDTVVLVKNGKADYAKYVKM